MLFEPRPEHLGDHWGALHFVFEVRIQCSWGFTSHGLVKPLLLQVRFEGRLQDQERRGQTCSWCRCEIPTGNIHQHPRECAGVWGGEVCTSNQFRYPNQTRCLPNVFAASFDFNSNTTDPELTSLEEYLDQHLHTHAQQKVLPAPKTQWINQSLVPPIIAEDVPAAVWAPQQTFASVAHPVQHAIKDMDISLQFGGIGQHDVGPNWGQVRAGLQHLLVCFTHWFGRISSARTWTYKVWNLAKVIKVIQVIKVKVVLDTPFVPQCLAFRSQAAHLQMFREARPDKAIYDLSANPNKRCRVETVDKCMPCLTTSAQLWLRVIISSWPWYILDSLHILVFRHMICL